MTRPRKRRLRPDEAGYQDPGEHVIELAPIDIVGDPNADIVPMSEVPLEEDFDDGRSGHITELAPIDIVGDPNASDFPVNNPDLDRRKVRAADVTEPMIELPDFVVNTIGQPVTDNRTGLAGWESSDFLASLVADDDGNAPEGVLEAGANFFGAPFSSDRLQRMQQRYRATGEAVPELERTTYFAPAVAGFAAPTSLGLLDEAAEMYHGEDEASALEWTEREYPGSYASGELGALAASLAIPGAQASGGRWAQAATTGLDAGIQGLLSGFGNSEEDTFAGRAQDAALSGLAGAGLGGGLGYLSGRMAERANDAVTGGSTRERRASAWDWLSQAGADQSSARQRMLVSGGSEASMSDDAIGLVDQLREYEIIPAYGARRLPPSADEIQRRIGELAERGNQSIRSVSDEMGDTPIDTSNLVGMLDQEIGRLRSIPTASSRMRELQSWRDRLSASGDVLEADRALAALTPGPAPRMRRGVPFRQLQSWKTDVGEQANYDPTLRNVASETYRAVTQAMQDAVDARSPDLGGVYRTGRQQSRLGYIFDEAAASDARREGRNRTKPLSTYLAQGLGLGAVGSALEAADVNVGTAGMGAAAGAIGMGALNDVRRAHEHGLRAASRERAAAALLRSPERFGRWASRLQIAQRKGPRLFGAALYAAMQDDPQVRQAVMSNDENVATEPKIVPEQPAQMDVIDENVDLDAIFQGDDAAVIDENTSLEDLFQ